MSSTVKYSVIVTLYNYSSYIKQCVKSILKQNIDKNLYEIIIVDDCSTDNSYDVIKPFLDKYDNIQYIKHNENMGYSSAKNTGILASKGEYITMIDADDLMARNSLLSRGKFLDKNKELNWVFGRALIFSGNNIKKTRKDQKDNRWPIWKKTRDKEILYKSINPQTVMVRKEMYEKYGLYDIEMRCKSDREMWARFVYQNEIPGRIIDIVAYYRTHKNQMCRSKWKHDRLEEIEKDFNERLEMRKKEINSSNTVMWKMNENKIPV